MQYIKQEGNTLYISFDSQNENITGLYVKNRFKSIF